MSERTTRELADWLERSIRDYPTSPDNQPCDRTAIAAKLRKLAEIEDTLECEKDDRSRLEDRWLANYARHIINGVPMPVEKLDLLDPPSYREGRKPLYDARPEQPEAMAPAWVSDLDEYWIGFNEGQKYASRSNAKRRGVITRAEFDDLKRRVEACERGE